MKRVLWIFFITAVLTGIGLLGYLYYIYDSIKTTAQSIYTPLEMKDEGTQSIDAWSSLYHNPFMLPGTASGEADSADEEMAVGQSAVEDTAGTEENEDAVPPFTLLFLGVDEREHDIGRSDSILVACVNPGKGSMLMFNIPRDTLTEIIGKGKMDKINHAYAFGGVSMAVKTVEHFLDIPIDYYVKVNMEGFSKIIDILGGVQVDNKFGFEYEGQSFPEGRLSLNGDMALLYSRMRYDDPHGDMGRNERQRQILKELVKHSEKFVNLAKLPGILAEIKANAKTNLTLEDMLELNRKYRSAIQSMEVEQVQGTGEKLNQIYYYKVEQAERDRINARLREQLKG